MSDPARLTTESLEIIEEVETLRLLIHETDSSLLAFALYRSVVDREAAVRKLKERLKLPVVEFTLSKQQKNAVSLLYSLPQQDRHCAFFYDVEEALPEVAGYVNLQREAFADVPHAVIFWVREHGMRELMSRAPDFWSWHSGVFDFRSEQLRCDLGMMQAVLPDPAYFKDRGDLERRVILYERLIDEYRQQKEPHESFLARLHYRLGVALHQLARFEEAEGRCREALEYTQRAGDRRTEAAVVHLSGVLAEERWQLDQAEQKYHQSIDISREIKNEPGVAVCYHHLGNVAFLRKQFDRAETFYKKALEIRGRLGLERWAAGDYHHLGYICYERQQFARAEKLHRKALQIYQRLGMKQDIAKEYHHLGMIADQKQAFNEAERWYKSALEIFETLGLEREAAGSYHQLGIIAQERQQFEEAQTWYNKALRIRARLRHAPSLVNTLAQFGALRREQGEVDEAVSWFGKALAIAMRHEMPVAAQILINLALVMNDVGEHRLAAAWREAFRGEEPPLEALREVLKKMEGGVPESSGSAGALRQAEDSGSPSD